MTIGIPRALVYWKKPYFWEDFFQALGFETVHSPPTNKDIVRVGVKVADPETCFSTKIYWGHLLWLDGKCDMIFVPRLKTNKLKLEYCPKFFGLPDLAKIMTKTPILTQTFDARREPFEKSLFRLGKKLRKSRTKVKKAASMGVSRENEKKEEEKKHFLEKVSTKKAKIILISHPYNLYDTYVNLRTEEKLKQLGVQPIIIDEIPLPSEDIEEKEGTLSDPAFHWEFGKEIVAKIREIFKYDIAGGIEISAFQCGCDGVLKEFVEREFKEEKKPFLYLLIDEHTGEAGLQTRLEAFIDTIN